MVYPVEQVLMAYQERMGRMESMVCMVVMVRMGKMVILIRKTTEILIYVFLIISFEFHSCRIIRSTRSQGSSRAAGQKG